MTYERLQAVAEEVATAMLNACEVHGPVSPQYGARVVFHVLHRCLDTSAAPSSVDLAYLGRAMRKAQAAYFAARRAAPTGNHDREFQAARAAEKQFDAAVLAVLNAQQQAIPGMEEGGEGPV